MTSKLRHSITIPTIELFLRTEKTLNFDNSIGLRGFMEAIFQRISFYTITIMTNLSIHILVFNIKSSMEGLLLLVGRRNYIIKKYSTPRKIILGHESVKVNGMDLIERNLHLDF